MEENEMSRSTTQVIYKYLPGSWIDFYLRGKQRRTYIAHVERWNSNQLTNINTARLLRRVNQAVRSFRDQAEDKSVPVTDGFSATIDETNCDVLTPKSGGDERGVVAKISPLTFYCPKCGKVYQFSSERDYWKAQYCKNPDCKNARLVQYRTIYYCTCGYATDKHPACREHGTTYLYRKDNYSFVCRKCHRTIPMIETCPVCKAKMLPKPALDPSQYFTYSLSYIDLIDQKTENFISNTDYGAYATIAYWLGLLSKEDIDTIRDSGITTDQDKYDRVYKSFYDTMKGCGLDENSAKVGAKAAADKQCGNNYMTIIEGLKPKLSNGLDPDDLKLFAEMILEFDMIRDSKYALDLSVAKAAARKLNTNARPEEFDAIAAKYGIVDCRSCDKLPIVSCAYGYTREKPQYEEGVRLHAFAEETKGRQNVYALKLLTEGVLFEFDRVRIINWLIQNEFLRKEDAPDLDSEEDVKIWFINNISLKAIKPFTDIDEEEAPLTSAVYTLIHSIAHVLIKAAADLSGLSQDSLSEYIFAGIPAVLIYCQNSQGYTLGALNNMFEAYFDRWVKNAAGRAEKCIYDPICLERYKACTGCMFLNEVSCEHFNKDLNRRLLVGYIDRETGKRTYGFWEK